MYSAINDGSLDKVKELLDTYPAWINQKCYSGLKPIQRAAYEGHADIIEELVLRGVDLNDENDYGWTSLDWACYKHHTHVIEKLFKLGLVLDNEQLDSKIQLFSCKHFYNENVVKCLVQIRHWPRLIISLKRKNVYDVLIKLLLV